MDSTKEKALLGWLGSLLDTEDGSDSLRTLDYGTCFVNIVTYMDSSVSVDDFPSRKDKVWATKKFLEDFYSISFLDGSLVDFNVLSEATLDTEAREEVAKVLLLLLCAGIQDKNSDILTAAMRVDASLHWDVRQLIEAVVRPDEPTTSLPLDFAKVLMESSGPRPNDSPGFFCRLANTNSSSSSGGLPAVPSARLAALPEIRDSPLRLRIASLNLSNMNDSAQITSPLRTAESDFPFTPLEELVNSPQLARKIMWREKEYRVKLERQLSEREEKLKKCQQDLRTGTHLRDELELDLQECLAQIHSKDCRIQELTEQVQRLRALQDQLNELGAVHDSNVELERDVETLRSVAQTADTLKQCCQSLREENSSLYEDLSTLRDKVSHLEACQQESSKEQGKRERLQGRLSELEGEVDTWREAWGKVHEQKRVLEGDMEVLKKVNAQQRQQLLDRSGSVGDISGGESMDVVTDKLVEELRAELHLMRTTWLSPDLHLATKHDLEVAQTSLKQLQMEGDALRQTVQELTEELQGAQSQLREATDRCQHLQTEVEQDAVDRDHLQSTLDDLQSQQTSWLADRDDLQGRLDNKGKECEGLLIRLQNSTLESDQLQGTVSRLQSQCEALTSDLHDKEARLGQAQEELEQKSEQCDQLTSELDSRTQRLEERQSALQEAEAAAEVSQSRYQKLEQTLAERSSEITDLTQRCEEVERTLADQQEESGRVTCDLTRCQLSLQHSEQEVDRLRCSLQRQLDDQRKAATQERGGKVQALLSQLQESEACITGLRTDLELKEESLQRALESQRKLQDQTQELRSLTQHQEKVISEKHSELKELQGTSSAMEDKLTEVSAELKEASMWTAQAEADRSQALCRLTSLEETVPVQLMAVREECRQEVESLKAAHAQTQHELELKISELESSVQQKAVLLEERSEEVERSRQKLESMQNDHASKVEELQRQLSLKTQELEERQKLESMHNDHASKVEELQRQLSVKTQELEERQKLESMHNDHASKVEELQRQLSVKTQELEERQKLESMQNDHASKVEELQRHLSVKTQELEEERQKQQSSEQQLHRLDAKFHSMEKTLRTVQDDHVDNEKVLLDNLQCLQTSAAAKEMELQEIISTQTQQITRLDQQVDELEHLMKQKENALIAAEKQHKADVEAIQTSASPREEQLQGTVNSQRQELSTVMQKLENHKCVIGQKDEMLHQLELKHQQDVETIQQSVQKEEELQATIHVLKQQMVEIQHSLKCKDLALNQTEMLEVQSECERQEPVGNARQSHTTERDAELSGHSTTSSLVQEDALCGAVNQLIGAVETRCGGDAFSERLISGVAELGAAPAACLLQLAKSLDTLLQETKASEQAAQKKEQELQVRLKEAESGASQLQTTITRLSQESQQVRVGSSGEEHAHAIKKIQEESEQKLQAVINQLEVQKWQSAAEAKETEEYWKQQLRSLQDDMERDVKQQRLAFENELAEQRAEYDTCLNSVLEEQEGMRLGQKVILEDKLQSLQDALASSKAQFIGTLAEKEAEFQQKISAKEAETEKRVASLKDAELASLLEEKEVEFQEKWSAQEAEMEQQLASLNQCLQKEMESQRTIGRQMEQDRGKIQHLETQLAERCQELEELLHTEQEERGEVVERVVQENQEELRALQRTLEQERRHSLRQITELQAETSVIKEELAVSVQRTQMLQSQLSELERQKEEAVRQVQRDVDQQIAIVRHTEDHNTHLQAKIVELESVMSQRKAELMTLRSSLEEQRGQRAQWQARERELLEEVIGQQRAREDQVKQLTGRVAALKVECQALKADNKTIQGKAADTTKAMAEQLKRYERKCQQNETQRAVLEDGLKAYMVKEVKWKEDSGKMEELSERLRELESSYMKTATGHTAAHSPAEMRSPVDLPSTSHYDLRSRVSVDLDSSFTNTLPATPGAAEKQMQGLRGDTNSVGSRQSSARYSTYSTSSSKSVVFVPTGAGKMFSCEDEPESPKFEWGRLNELQRRNTLCPPHMKSSYPVETQAVTDPQLDDNSTQQPAKHPHRKAKQASPSASSSLDASSRKRKPEAMDVEEEPDSHATGVSQTQSRKLARHGPLYQRPGPPTPLTERHRKLSDPHLPTAGPRRKPGTPRRSPRYSPRRSRVRAAPGRYADENVMPDPHPRGMAFDIGFSLARTGSTRSLTRQNAFLSKSTLPGGHKTEDPQHSLSAPSTSAPADTKGKASTRSRTAQPAQPSGKRKPLTVRNCLQTQL